MAKKIRAAWCCACKRTHTESAMEIYDVANDKYCCTQAAYDKFNGIVRIHDNPELLKDTE